MLVYLNITYRGVDPWMLVFRTRYLVLWCDTICKLGKVFWVALTLYWQAGRPEGQAELVTKNSMGISGSRGGLCLEKQVWDTPGITLRATHIRVATNWTLQGGKGTGWGVITHNSLSAHLTAQHLQSFTLHTSFLKLSYLTVRNGNPCSLLKSDLEELLRGAPGWASSSCFSSHDLRVDRSSLTLSSMLNGESP